MIAILGIALIIIIIIRLVYRATVTRDLRQRPDELYLGIGLIVIWAIIYLYIYLS